MLKHAGRVHGSRLLLSILLIALTTWGAIEGYGTLRASALVDSLRAAGTTDVPAVIEQLTVYRRWADRRLLRMLRDSDESSRDRLHASLALLPVDPSQADYLGKRLLGIAPAELPVLREALAPYRNRLTPTLWAELKKARPDDPALLASAAALALYDPDAPRWSELGAKVAEALVQVNPILLGHWLDALRPVRVRLAGPLERIFLSGGAGAKHELATSILADYAADDPDRLAGLLVAADPKAYVVLFPVAERRAAQVLPHFKAELEKRAKSQGPALTEPAKDELAERQARAAVSLVRLGHSRDVWPLLRYSADPQLRSYIVNWLNPLGADPKQILAELDRLASVGRSAATSVERGAPVPDRKVITNAMAEILFQPETSIRRALILALVLTGPKPFLPASARPWSPGSSSYLSTTRMPVFMAHRPGLCGSGINTGSSERSPRA